MVKIIIMERVRNFHRPESTEETWQQNAVFCPGWDSNQKRTLAEKLVKSKSSLEFNSNVLVLVLSCNKCTSVA